MQKIKVVVLFCGIFLLCTSFSYAQSRLPGQWSLSANGGYDLPGSSSMRGSLANFERTFGVNYTNYQYPFGDSRAIGLDFGGQLAYRFRTSNIRSNHYTYSNWSAYLGVQVNVFNVDDQFISGLSYNSFNLTAFTWTLGAEYTLGDPSDLLNAFARAGLNTSAIGGSIVYNYYYTTTITEAFRFGYEAEIGGRLNIPATPLAVEASVNYTNANPVGMKYVAPATLQNSNILRERALNDGINPNDPADNGRTINFVSFRLGGRIWF